MRNLELHFRKPQSQSEIQPKQPRFAAVPGQSHSSLQQMSPFDLQNSGCSCLCLSACHLCHLHRWAYGLASYSLTV